MRKRPNPQVQATGCTRASAVDADFRKTVSLPGVPAPLFRLFPGKEARGAGRSEGGGLGWCKGLALISQIRRPDRSLAMAFDVVRGTGAFGDDLVRLLVNDLKLARPERRKLFHARLGSVQV